MSAAAISRQDKKPLTDKQTSAVMSYEATFVKPDGIIRLMIYIGFPVSAYLTKYIPCS